MKGQESPFEISGIARKGSQMVIAYKCHTNGGLTNGKNYGQS